MDKQRRGRDLSKVPEGAGVTQLAATRKGRKTKRLEQVRGADPRTDPDYNSECEVCGATPVVPVTGMCGPCTFGEAETAGGNW